MSLVQILREFGVMVWRRSRWAWNFRRRFSTAIRQRIEDEGDWSFSSEWWGSESHGHTVLRSSSEKGNGVVSVLAFPSSKPVSLAHSHSLSLSLNQQLNLISIYFGCRVKCSGLEWRDGYRKGMQRCVQEMRSVFGYSVTNGALFALMMILARALSK